MEKGTVHYTKGDLTVVWKPELCQHSTNCWKGLRSVFDPMEKPWVNMDGAEEERIVEQVCKCPSGALSIIRKEYKTN
jgi:uncharacterized Fe-S cluster protein YjdI